MNAYWIAVPLVTLICALYGTVMPFGVSGYLAGAAGGLLWSLVLGFAAAQLSPDAAAFMGNAVLLCCIVEMGLLNAGLLYMFVFLSVLREPSTTHAVLSAMMRPTVPYFIALNSAMELLFVPLVVFLNWPAGPWRIGLGVTAATLYAIQRVWTYVVYAKPRLDTASRPLTTDDVEWYTRTMRTDYRVVLNILILTLFAAAAFWPRG